MVVTPGPALVVIPVGLAILSLEFTWARHWLKRLRESISNHNSYHRKNRAEARFRAYGLAAVVIGILALIMLLMLVGMVGEVLPLTATSLLAALLMILTRCLSWKDAMSALSTQVILIIVASLAMGAALLKTGGADYIARMFVTVSFGAPPAVVLGGLMLMMGILTNIVSNNAAAVIGTPIAIAVGIPLYIALGEAVFGF